MGRAVRWAAAALRREPPEDHPEPLPARGVGAADEWRAGRPAQGLRHDGLQGDAEHEVPAADCGAAALAGSAPPGRRDAQRPPRHSQARRGLGRR